MRRRWQIFLVMLGLGLTLACSQEDAELKNIGGEEPTMGLLVGQGFNHIDWTPKGHCVKVGKLETQSGQSSGQSAEHRILEITSVSSLREQLNVSASASFRAGIFGSASTRLNYGNSINKNANSRFLLVHTRVGNQLQLGRDFEFHPEAQSLLEKGDQENFVHHCGTQFVYGVRTGGEFFALFEFDFKDEQAEREFSLAIKAVGPGWKASTDVNHELHRFQMNARVQLTMFRNGSGGDLPEVKDLESFAREYPKMLSVVSQDYVTLELITKDYGGVRPLTLTPNKALWIRQDHVMNQLARNRDEALTLLNRMRDVTANPARYEPYEAVTPVATLESNLLRYLNAQNDAAVECFADIWQGCHLPELPLPMVPLPVRRFPQAGCGPGTFWSETDNSCCHYEVHSECVIFDDDGACLALQTKRRKVCP